jgi:hypothetical protein
MVLSDSRSFNLYESAQWIRKKRLNHDFPLPIPTPIGLAFYVLPGLISYIDILGMRLLNDNGNKSYRR